MAALKNIVRRTFVAGVAVAALAALTGCDLLSVAGMVGGYYSDYGYSDYGYGGYGYYDPTDIIQSTVGYQQEVMDNSAMAWDQYITGDYYGGDNDDWSTPTYWASGPEWP